MGKDQDMKEKWDIGGKWPKQSGQKASEQGLLYFPDFFFWFVSGCNYAFVIITKVREYFFLQMPHMTDNLCEINCKGNPWKSR